PTPPHFPIGKRSGDGPAWSPDGKQIAFVGNDSLYVMAVTPDGEPGTAPHQVTQELPYSVSWAGPNRILYIATDRLKLIELTTGTTRDIPIDLTWRRKQPSARVVVHAGRLIDGRQQSARADVDVIVEGHRIRAIARHRAAPPTGTVADASGLSVMPGLIEAHGHQLKEHGGLFGRVHLAYGITTGRSAARVHDA